MVIGFLIFLELECLSRFCLFIECGLFIYCVVVVFLIRVCDIGICDNYYEIERCSFNKYIYWFFFLNK